MRPSGDYLQCLQKSIFAYLVSSVALESAVLKYLHAHFIDGVFAVFSPKEGIDHFTIQIVANKYNPTNFW